MSRRLIYEINTRCWLRELSHQAGRTLHLGTIPDAELEGWNRLGITDVWLMGVWITGPQARACYLNHPDTARHLRELLPDWTDEDVLGSPYAVERYQVPSVLGGEEGLRKFRERLHQHGMKLILDFVPNHLGLDHQWVTERPDLFVQGRPESGEAFDVETKVGRRWLAHGKDPYFPAWVDTAQLDYRRADTRAAVIDVLKSVADRCDGVRCDMAMLLLEDVFARTWTGYPVAGPLAIGEFWAEALAAVKRPEFTFMAEAYWDLEERLQQLDFDLTYDKRVTDFVIERQPVELSKHLLGKSAEYLPRGVHFLENHDEPRIAGRLSLAEHRAAALLVLALPGVCLLHEGQLTGARIRTSVHLSRRSAELVNRDIAGMYEELLAAIGGSALGHGHGRCLQPEPLSPGDATNENLVVILWSVEGGSFDLVVVNLASGASRAWVKPPPCQIGLQGWIAEDWLGDAIGQRAVQCLEGQGIVLEIPAYGAYGIRFKPLT